MSKITNVPSIHEEKIEINRNAIEHRATWMALMFKEAEKMGYNAEAFARSAIKHCGTIHGRGFKCACNNPENARDFAGVFLSEVGKKTFEMEVREVDENNVKVEFHYCPLLNAWKKLGLSDDDCAKLCDIAMDGDRGIAEAMGMQFSLTETIAQGHPTCKVHFYK